MFSAILILTQTPENQKGTEMDNSENHLKQINYQLSELNKKASAIVVLLSFAATGAFMAGRAAVLQYGIWKLLGF